MPGGVTNVAVLKDPEDIYNVKRLVKRLRKEIVRKKDAKAKAKVDRENAIERSLLHKEKQAKKLKVVARSKFGFRFALAYVFVCVGLTRACWCYICRARRQSYQAQG